MAFPRRVLLSTRAFGLIREAARCKDFVPTITRQLLGFRQSDSHNSKYRRQWGGMQAGRQEGSERPIAFENRQRRPQPTSPNEEQLTKVFASFFKKKRFFLFFFEKKNQKTFVYLVFVSGRSFRLECHFRRIPNAIPEPGLPSLSPSRARIWL
jgi:hypothetical protein